MARFEILEHTADVGIRAEGIDLSEVFEQATLGLLDISGTWMPGPGEAIEIEVDAADLGGLLVDWLEEVIYLGDSRDAVVTAVEMRSVSPTHASGRVELAPRDPETYGGGTQVKAITYHRLKVTDTGSGWEAEVYVDV